MNGYHIMRYTLMQKDKTFFLWLHSKRAESPIKFLRTQDILISHNFACLSKTPTRREIRHQTDLILTHIYIYIYLILIDFEFSNCGFCIPSASTLTLATALRVPPGVGEWAQERVSEAFGNERIESVVSLQTFIPCHLKLWQIFFSRYISIYITYWLYLGEFEAAQRWFLPVAWYPPSRSRSSARFRDKMDAELEALQDRYLLIPVVRISLALGKHGETMCCLYVLFDVVCRRIPQRDMSLQRLFCLMRARVCHRSTTGIVEKMRGWQEHEINSWYALNPVCVWLCDAKGSWAALETLFREHSCYTCSWGASDSDSFIPKVRVLHEMYRTS